MSTLKLIIANKNYSSWSLRGWLVARHSGLPFEELQFDLGSPDFAKQVAPWSPTGLVPVLETSLGAIWDSLAIAEYLAEQVPALWPQEAAARALARSVSAEMHSGFMALRQSMPMDIKASKPHDGRRPEVLHDIARIVAIWEGCRARFAAGGPFLFGAFSAADARSFANRLDVLLRRNTKPSTGKT